MRNLVAIAAALGLAACSSTPTSISQARAVDQANVFALDLQSKSPDRTVPVLVVRDSGFMGSFFGAIIVVEGRNAAVLKPEEQFEFYRAPGDHVFSVRPGDSPLSTPMAVTRIEVQPNTPKRIDLRLVKTEGPRITWSLQVHE